MLSNFERSRFQVFIEQSVGCTDIEKLKQYKTQFLAFSVTHPNENELYEACKKDGRDLYFKGALSLAQGISDINYGLHSWAIAKLYYAVFYFLKSSLALRGFGLIRCGGPIHSLKVEIGQVPQKVKLPAKQHGDHKTAMAAWRNLMGEKNDILLSQTIDDLEPYIWLMKARETVQYRRKTFLEPTQESFFSNLVSSDISKALDIYDKDQDPIYPFEKDNACLALPVMRGVLSFDDLSSSGQRLTDGEKVVLNEIIGPFISSNSKLRKIFS